MDEITSLAKITTREMHTCGTPIRIVEDGFPKILGENILRKISFVQEKYDHLRRFMCCEPRGHHFMVVLQLEPDHPEADVAAMFIEKEGYVTMCGEAVLSLGRYFVDSGKVAPREPETVIKIQCPCGIVPLRVEYKEGKSGKARFQSVPSFLFAKDVSINLDGIGATNVQISYGGCFYGIVSAHTLGLDLRNKKDIETSVRRGHEITQALNQKIKLKHPENPNAGVFNGTLVVDFSKLESHGLIRQQPVFRETEGRGPCGSGTSAILAYLFSEGKIGLNESKIYESAISGGRFTAKVISETKCGPLQAVTVEVCGHGFYTGRSTLEAEADDPLWAGFSSV